MVDIAVICKRGDGQMYVYAGVRCGKSLYTAAFLLREMEDYNMAFEEMEKRNQLIFELAHASGIHDEGVIECYLMNFEDHKTCTLYESYVCKHLEECQKLKLAHDSLTMSKCSILDAIKNSKMPEISREENNVANRDKIKVQDIKVQVENQDGALFFTMFFKPADRNAYVVGATSYDFNFILDCIKNDYEFVEPKTWGESVSELIDKIIKNYKMSDEGIKKDIREKCGKESLISGLLEAKRESILHNELTREGFNAVLDTLLYLMIMRDDG